MTSSRPLRIAAVLVPLLLLALVVPQVATGQPAVPPSVPADTLLVAPPIADGGAAVDDVASNAAIGGTWARYTTPVNRAEVPGRHAHSMIYNPVRDSMIVFGGYRTSGSAYLADVWEMSLSETQATTAQQLQPIRTPPSARAYHSAIYDPVDRRMVVFGGYDGSAGLNDVWVLWLSGTPQWAQLTPGGIGPCARWTCSAVYDPVRRRMLVFGGRATGNVFLNDVWALSLEGTPTWTQLTPAGTLPAGRQGHRMIHDPARDRLVVFGGFTGSARLNDVWELSLGDTPTWTQLTPAGTPPSARYYSAAVHDPAGDRMLVFGGVDTSRLGDLWELSLGDTPAWTQLFTGNPMPVPRYLCEAALDPVRRRMVLFGGTAGSASFNDLWVLSLAEPQAWTNLVCLVGLSGAPGRYEHTAIHDPVRDRMVVFGGTSGSRFNDVWALSLGGSADWVQLAPMGTAPLGRYCHSAIYDPVRDRMVVFGGTNDGLVDLNDAWALSFRGTPAWTQLAPSGESPAARRLHSAVYDPVGDRMLVFGGKDVSNSFSDVWTLSLGDAPAWTQLEPSGTPPGVLSGQGAVYDPWYDRLVVFQGSDVWALSLGEVPTWTRLATTGTPGTTWWPSGIRDPVRRRAVMFGGYEDYFNNFTRALSFGDAPAWTQLIPEQGTPPSARSGHSAIYDPLLDRMVLFGGYDLIQFLFDDTWTLTWGQPGLLGVGCPGGVVWTPGAGISVGYGVTNPYAFSQIADYAITCARGWPGFPVTGTVTLGAAGTTTVPLMVSPPDTAAYGEVLLTFRAVTREVPQSVTCSHYLSEMIIPVQLALVSAEAEPDVVRLTWYAASGAVSATVYRRTEATAWAAAGSVVSDGTGQLVYEDRAVTPGARYGYRLGVTEDGAEVFLGEAWVDVPLVAQLALDGARPNPALRELAVAFSLPDGSPARLEAYDLAGRRVAVQDVGALGAGSHTVRLGEGRALGCGVYLVRLTRAGRTLTTRAVVVR